WRAARGTGGAGGGPPARGPGRGGCRSSAAPPAPTPAGVPPAPSRSRCSRAARSRSWPAPPAPVADPLAGLSAPERARLRRAPAPARFEAMKAVLTDERFSNPEWLYERKLDGIRSL